MTQEQLDYVKEQLAVGIDPVQLRTNLLSAGYADQQVTQLMIAAQTGATAPLTPAQSSGMPWWAWVLIGLFLIIPVMGILLAVALSSFNDARQAATDASYKQSLSSLRSSAEIYADSNLPAWSYEGFCIQARVQSVLSTIPQVVCEDSEDSYRMSLQLSNGSYWCVDSLRNSGEQSARPSGLQCK